MAAEFDRHCIKLPSVITGSRSTASTLATIARSMYVLLCSLVRSMKAVAIKGHVPMWPFWPTNTLSQQQAFEPRL